MPVINVQDVIDAMNRLEVTVGFHPLHHWNQRGAIALHAADSAPCFYHLFEDDICSVDVTSISGPGNCIEVQLGLAQSAGHSREARRLTYRADPADFHIVYYKVEAYMGPSPVIHSDRRVKAVIESKLRERSNMPTGIVPRNTPGGGVTPRPRTARSSAGTSAPFTPSRVRPGRGNAAPLGIRMVTFDAPKFVCSCWPADSDKIYCEHIETYFEGSNDVGQHYNMVASESGVGKVMNLPFTPELMISALVTVHRADVFNPSAGPQEVFVNIADEHSNVSMMLMPTDGLKVFLRAMRDFYLSVPEIESIKDCVVRRVALPCQNQRHKRWDNEAFLKQVKAVFASPTHISPYSDTAMDALLLSNAYTLHNLQICFSCWRGKQILPSDIPRV